MKILLNLNIAWDRNDIVNLRNSLKSVKELNKKELSKVRESANYIEDDQKFIAKEFEDQK